jgi:DNA-binding transcriptional LysR family regulator
MDLLPSLSVFLRVTETGSFSRAADSLGMTRSMVTRRIQALEEDLGTKLFFRSTRKVTLSSEGMELLVRARDLLAKTNALYVELRDQAGKPLFGSIRIASSVIIGWVFLQKVVQEFLDANPGVTIELVTEDQPIKMVDEGIDLAFKVGNRLPDSSVAKKSELSRITSARVPNSSKSRARFPARVTSKKSIFW